MILAKTIKNWKFSFTIARIARPIGVNSELDDGRHILMWDFDDTSLNKVMDALWQVQFLYALSDIHILETKLDTNFMAYCFTALEWRRVVRIVVSTQYVDWAFIRFGVFRGKFTLRVTPKGDRTPHLISRLEGYNLPDVKPTDLKSWAKYETLSWR